MTRGDTAYISFTLTDQTGEPVVLGDGDAVRCQVRKEPNGGELIFEGNVEIGDEIVWHITPAETADVPVGAYYWDCQVEFSNGDIFTFIPVSIFMIADEVTEVI